MKIFLNFNTKCKCNSYSLVERVKAEDGDDRENDKKLIHLPLNVYWETKVYKFKCTLKFSSSGFSLFSRICCAITLSSEIIHLWKWIVSVNEESRHCSLLMPVGYKVLHWDISRPFNSIMPPPRVQLSIELLCLVDVGGGF